MTALSYSGLVPYETFRDRWKYAVIGVFGFGAFLSPPDPFTQLLWAAPLIILYGFSLYLAKIVVTTKRRSDRINLGGTLRKRWNVLAGIAVLVGGGTFAFLTAGGARLVNRELLPLLPATLRPAPFRPIDVSWGLPRDTAVVGATVGMAVFAILLIVLYSVYRDLVGETGSVPADPRDPAAIDLEHLDAGGVQAAPEEAFAEMEESDALGAAKTAMEADEAEKAQAILDRYDAAEAASEEAADDGETADEAGEDTEAEDQDVFSRTAEGMVGAFTDDDSDDDIGGYYYDLRFIFNSLRSRAFRLVIVFGTVMSLTFLALYSGGVGLLYDDFLSRLPPGVTQQNIDFSVITLHPVEALVFMVKLSVVLGAVAVVPFLAYYAWPALRERGLASGDRRVLSVWGGLLLGGLIAGSAAGYLVIAPEVISWLVFDAVREGMRVSYRVSSFFWLIFLLTVGIGLLVDVPMSMLLFHFGGLVSFGTMRRGWKVFVLGALVVGAVLTPGSVYTMLVVAIPTALAYALGLGTLWVLTLGGRSEWGRPQAE
jgi:sec-independent protein translocase protein TatC